MIASDVAAEGINLHYQSHRLLHFDIPWSLLTFQQRNGRVDRYGQNKQPEIYYLLTDSSHDKIRGDQRILKLLIERDAEVQRNIGDPSEFTGLHTIEEEELAVAAAIESGAPPEQALAETFAATSASDDWFNAFLNAQPSPSSTTSATPAAPTTTSPPSLYQSDYHWAKEGFESLRANKIPIEVHADEKLQQIDISQPEELRRRLKKHPDEIIANPSGLISLSADRNALNREIIRWRSEENLWPRLHLLWELHPALRWMQDKLLSKFGRNQAACVHLRHLDPGERIVLGTGIIPNRKGQTLILSHWDPLFAYLPVETVIRDQQANYYKVLATCDKAGNSTAFIEFLLTSLLTALREAVGADQVSDQVTDQVRSLLRTLGKDTLTAVECMKRLKLSHRPTFRANYLNPALSAGLIEYTIPEKPQSRLQKYRITENGREASSRNQ